MGEYIELTEELFLSMRAGARAIANTKKYHGKFFVSDVFSENPKEIEYLHAAEILCTASGNDHADVAPVRHGKWEVNVGMNFFRERNCPVCKKRIESNFWNFCPNCGAKMDGDGHGG